MTIANGSRWILVALLVGAGCGGGDDGAQATPPASSGASGSSAAGASGASGSAGTSGGAAGHGGSSAGKGGGGASTGGSGTSGSGQGMSGSSGQTAGGAAGSGGGGAGGAPSSGGAGGFSAGGSSAGGAAGSGQSGAGQGGGASSCLSTSLLDPLGKTHVLVGASMEDATAKMAPFDGRYLYLAGGLFDGTSPCASCATGCTAGGQSCANSNPNGCAWWGCWQYDQDPPGSYATGFIGTAKGDAQIPMITYYEILPASGASEGMGEVDAANDVAFMSRYLADFRFLAQKIGQDVAFVHVEPDFWGYAEQANEDPHMTPAAVATALPDDCGGQENSIAGLGRCMISLVRKYAPNAKASLHASAWGTKIDVLANTDPSFDVAGEAGKLGAFLLACGAGDGDMIVADMSDRDAGYYQSIGKDTWWDATNATLPNFHQAFAWSKALAESTQKPVVFWQIPVGNESLPDTPTMWKDNRVDYLFAHMDEVAAAHVAGLFFGAGAGDQTTPSTDGGNLVAKVNAYASAPQAACP